MFTYFFISNSNLYSFPNTVCANMLFFELSFFYCSLQHYLSKLFFIFFLHLNYFFFFFFICTDNQIFLIKVSSTYLLLLLPFTCKYEVKKNRSCYNHLSLIIIDSIGLNTAAHIFEWKEMNEWELSSKFVSSGK